MFKCILRKCRIFSSFCSISSHISYDTSGKESRSDPHFYVYCLLYIRKRSNMEIDKVIKGAVIVRFIKAQRIKWLGHIQRMDQARPTRKLLDWKPMGTRPIGRPRQRWHKDVMEDIKKLKFKN